MTAPRIVDEICRRYDVGPALAQAYLAYWTQPGGRHDGRHFASLDEILSLPAPDPEWFDYALSSNRRARVVRDALLPHLPPREGTASLLDLECELGGRLLAFAEAGFVVRGSDRDPALVELAAANARDAGLEHVVSVAGAGDDADGERFDVVTMLGGPDAPGDVLPALRRAADRLAEGGVAFVTVPNACYLPWIIADPVHGLFGATLLDRQTTDEYARALEPETAPAPGVLALASLRAELEPAGISVDPVHAALHASDPVTSAADRLGDIGRAFSRYLEAVRPRVPAAVDAELQLAFSRFTTGVLDAHRRAGASTGADAATTFGAAYLSRRLTVRLTRTRA